MSKNKKIKDNENINFLLKDIEKILNSENVSHGLGRALRNFRKELILYQNFLESKITFQKSIFLKPKYNKIQIGGGKHILKGFFNIDILPPADFIWDVREGLPLKNECCNFIFMEHFLEHIDYPISVKKVIKECFRVLKKGGKIVIGVPDAELALKKYNLKDKKFFKKIVKKWYCKRTILPHINTYIDLINCIFRDQDDDPKYTPHLWAYDFEKLFNLLKEAGFNKIKKWKFDEKIANPERKFGSIYVEGIKI